MKQILLFILLCAMFTRLSAQPNLVYNGSFEQHTNTTCQNGAGGVGTFCTGWDNFCSSPDFYLSCANTIPNNLFGYQQPADGQNYIGIWDFLNSSTYGFREAITAYITPMQIGATYEVSLSVSLANKASYQTNGICVHFFDTGVMTIPTNTANSPIAPKISFNTSQLSDTQNWVRLSTQFYADSAYDHIAIGGFLNLSSVSSSATGFSPSLSGFYWYVDSVVVKLAKRFGVSFTDTLLCIGDTIEVPYFVNTNPVYFLTNNVFTLQLSDASGSFSNPVNIGTKSSYLSDTIKGVIPTNTTGGTGYRIRMISSNGQDTTFDNGVDINIGTVMPAKPVANNNGPVCNNDTLSLTASSASSGVSYKWVGPNSFSSAVQNPNLPNPLPVNGGSYVVTAYINGCESKDTTTAVVHAGSGPTGTTATTNAPICANDTLKLFGTANGSSNTYSWTGPGNYSSSQKNVVIPMATAAMSGDYILYASNGNCISRDTVTVLVKPRPAAFASSSNAPLCTGQNLNFTTSSSSTGVTYAWSGPNGFNSTSTAPFINGVFAVHNGNYYVTATLNGCPLTDTLPVTVKPLPAKPVATNNSPLCAGGNLQLTGSSSTNGVAYSWTGPGSYTSTTQNPTVSNTITSMSGDYIVSVILNGCSTKDTTTVNIKPVPAPVTTSSNTPLCAGDTLKVFSTSSGSGVTYTWTGPASFNANTQNSSIVNTTTAMSGWYKMLVDLNGCIYEDSTQVTVYPIPAAPTVTYNNPICLGETLNLASGTVSGATYAWTGPGNFSSASQNPSRSNMQFGDTGTYAATVTVNGCTSAEGSAKVQLNANPFVVILANPADSICQGDPVVFAALPNNHGGTPSFRWMVNAQTTGTGTAFNTSTLNDGDVISCEMTENTKCSVPFKDESNDITMTVLPWKAPAVTITANPNHPLDQYEYITFTAVATDAGSNPKYQWMRNGQPQHGATSSTWSANTLNDNDSVSVEVTSSYKCPQPTTAKSNWIKIRLTGVDDITALGKVVLYPNPNNGKFVVEATSATLSKGVVTFIVTNVLGSVVYRDNVQYTAGKLYKELDMGAVPAGIYLLKLHTDNSMQVLRFSIK